MPQKDSPSALMLLPMDHRRSIGRETLHRSREESRCRNRLLVSSFQLLFFPLLLLTASWVEATWRERVAPSPPRVPQPSLLEKPHRSRPVEQGTGTPAPIGEDCLSGGDGATLSRQHSSNISNCDSRSEPPGGHGRPARAPSAQERRASGRGIPDLLSPQRWTWIPSSWAVAALVAAARSADSGEAA